MNARAWFYGASFHDNTQRAAESLTCADCGKPITVKQYKQTDAQGKHHHYEPWDCAADRINFDEVERETEAAERKRRFKR